MLFDLDGAAGDERRLLLAVHHLVTDGVSWRLLLEDLERGLGGLPLPAKTTAYRDWARRLADHAGSPAAHAELAHWQTLARPALPLPRDLAGGPDTEGAVATVEAALSAEETRVLLQEVPRAYRTRIDDVLLTAVARAFSRWTGARALRIDLEAHGREELFEDVDLLRTVGCFTALYPAVLDVGGAADPGAALRKVKEQLRAIPGHGVGFGILRFLDLDAAAALAAIPPAEVSFNYLGRLDGALPAASAFAPAGEGMGPIRSPRAPRACAFELLGSVAGGRLRLFWHYASAVFLRATVERLAAGFLAELRQLIAHCLAADAGGLTPSDVPLAGLDQAALDRLPEAREIDDLYPLAPLQEGMLFHTLYAPGTGVYVVQAVSRIAGELDPAALRRAWQGAVDRHPILRTAFLWEGLAVPLQAVRRRLALPFQEEDWRALTEEAQERQLEDLLAADRMRGFDPVRPPLLRIFLLRTGERGWIQVWSQHHLLLDAWSGPLLLADVQALYAAELAAAALVRLPERRPWRDYVAWLAGRDLTADEAFWRRTLAGVESPTPLPGSRPAGPPGSDYEGADDEWTLELPAGIGAALAAGARRHHLTFGLLAQAAWGVALARSAGTPEALFGLTVAGRPPALAGAGEMIGPFINTVPVRVDALPEAPLLPWLRRLQSAQAELSQHEHAPLVSIQGWSGVARELPLFESLLLVENLPAGGAGGAAPGETASSLTMTTAPTRERTNYPLTLLVAPGERVRLRAAWQTGRLEPGAARRLVVRLAAVLEGMAAALAAGPDRPLAALPQLAAAERHQLLHEWSATAPVLGAPACLHGLIAAQAARTPEATALIVGVASGAGETREVTFSYLELDGRAARLAGLLRELGAGPGRTVGLRLARGWEMVLALLAVWKSGAAAVPLDPAAPAERLAWLAADCGAALVIAHQADEGTVALSDLESQAAGRPPFVPPAAELDPDLPAYVIYTSGSTGRPKGVVTPHRAAAHLLCHAVATHGAGLSPATGPRAGTPGYERLGPGHRVLQAASFGFDAAILELGLALATGAALCLSGADDRASGAALSDFVRRHRIGTVVGTPPVLGGLDADLPDLRVIYVGGEGCPGDFAARWAPRLRLLHCYGPTEATIYATEEPVAASWPADAGNPPIGRPVAGLRAVLLDGDLAPVPAGAVGELCLGGAGLALGYLGRPELTAAAFVPDPVAAEPAARRADLHGGPGARQSHLDGGLGARLYRTGDLARQTPDGRLVFLGRRDQQVKVRGVRIELGEIEAALRAHEAVAEAVVVRREDRPGDVRLVAYAVALPGAALPAPAELRSYLAGRLPQALVPAAVVPLAALPLTATGKLDRRALPASEAIPESGPLTGGQPWDTAGSPAGGLAAGPAADPLGDPIADILTGLWAEVLDLPRCGVHDDFFALGGHSLLATRLVARVRQVFGREVPLRDLFEAPTPAELAARIAADPAAEPLPAPVALPRPLPEAPPLSFAQQRLWFLDRLLAGGAQYNLPAALRLAGPLRPAALAAALSGVAARHEALRTVYPEAAGEPVQRVLPAAPVPLPRIDLAALPAAGRETEAGRLATAEAARPFDLARGPVLRAALLRLAEGDHVLFLSLHHIAADGWSIAVLVRELVALYGSADATLPPLPLQYVDYALWQRRWLAGAALDSQLAFWRERLAGAPPLLELPTDRPRPPFQRLQGASEEIRLDAGLAAELGALARRSGATLFMVLLAAFQTLLARLSGQDDVVVGSPVAGRRFPELEGLIGLFVNTLALRTDLAGDPTFEELLARVRRNTLDAYARQDLPFDRLVEELQPARSLAHAPLVQVTMALQNLPAAAPDPQGLEVRPFPFERRAAQFDWSLTWEEAPGSGLAGELVYDTDLFTPATARRALARLVRLLAGAAAEPGRRLSELPLLAPAERHQVVVEWNDTARPEAGGGLLLHELFEARADRAPGSPAIAGPGLDGGEERLTAGELEARANRLAWRLRELGVGPEVRVALFLERSVEQAVAILAVLKAGGAYLPLDPAQPAERLARMAEDAGPAVLVTTAARATAAPVLPGVPRVALDAERTVLAAYPSVRPPRLAHPGSLAYVLYTSGSTGRPKGVMVSHRAIVNRVVWRPDGVAPFGPADRLLWKTPFSFDPSLWEVFAPLATGALLVVAAPDGHRDPAYLARTVAEQGITLFQVVPSLLRALADEPGLAACTSLRYLICGGEELTAALCERFHALLPGTALYNHYGPTEASVDVTAWRSEEARTEDGRAVPLGRPLANTRLHILDGSLRPVPAGSPGELYLGGTGLARGYSGRPDLTAERFVPDPMGEALGARQSDRNDGPGTRLYRTGDLARRRPDGAVEFLGRVDHQVKIRGVRIEPGEVEAALAAHPAVRDVAVLVREERPGERRLVACVAASGVTAAELRAALAERLPEAMVPSGWVLLGALPLNPHGKVDRQALAALAPAAAAARAADATGAPLSPTEELVAACWAEVLGSAEVGREDDFFALGGHSLLATRLVPRLRAALGVELPLRTLFEAPTVAAQARAVEAALAEGRTPPPPLRPGERDEPPPLSFAQERLWFLDQLEPGLAAYNVPAALELAGPLQPAALAGALCHLARRHETLRTRYAESDGRGVQVIDGDAPLPLPVVDLAALAGSKDRAEAESRRLLAAESARPFDLARGPVARALLLRLAPQRHHLLLAAHHIAVDGWSLEVLVREAAALYEAAVAEPPSPLASLPPLPVQYADFACWQRRWLAGDTLAAEVAHWRQRLEDGSGRAPAPLDLPADRPRPALQSFRGAHIPLALPGDLSAAVADLARRLGATPFMTLLAAFQALLGRLAHRDDIVVGTPVANRRQAEVEGLVGFFVNTLPIAVDLSGAPSFEAVLARVRESALAAYTHQELPFERLVDELGVPRDLSRPPLVQVAFTLQQAAPALLAAAGVALRPLAVEVPLAKLDLTLSLAALPGGYAGAVEICADLFDRATGHRYASQFLTLLAAAAADPARPLADLPLLSQAEEHQLRREWNDTARTYEEGGLLLHELFEARVDRSPGSPALAGPSPDSERLTAAELETRANRLAWRLRELGVGPEALVALCLERSVDLVVALLAVLKAGGAYLPLDPSYPADRLALMADDARPAVLVTTADLAGTVPARPGLRRLLLDEERAGIAACPAARPPRAARPAGLAYVLYTSGSTGRPKGVMVPHAGIVNRLLWMQRDFLPLAPADRVLWKTPLSFDPSIWEIFAPLASGALLVVAAPGGHRDTPYLVRTVAEQGITVLQVVPSLLRALVEEPDLPSCTGLRHLICGAEELKPALCDRTLELLPRATLSNHYGPTETSIDVTAWVCKAGAGRTVSVGRPLANLRVVLLDAALQPVPIGVAGEVCLGGVGLARGYAGRPDLTAERFVPDPGAAAPGARQSDLNGGLGARQFDLDGGLGARLYRTGDLGRARPDGTLELLGRVDRQVKVRGIRVEPGEVEAALAAEPEVLAAAVTAVVDGQGTVRLFAYVVPRPGLAVPADLRERLGRRLPAALVPAAVVPLAALPLAANGKVDRAALPAPELGSGEGTPEAAAPPRTVVEERLAALWAEVLGLPRVGVHDDFFGLGGDSILSLQVVARARRLGIALTPRQLFQHPTVAGLAAVAEVTDPAGLAEAGRAASAPPEAAPGPVPLTSIQRWFLARGPAAPHHFNQAMLLAVPPAQREPAAAGRLAAALAAVAGHHDALRLRFRPDPAAPAGWSQELRGPAVADNAWPLTVCDLAALPPDRRRAAREAALAAAQAGLDLAAGPTARALLLTLGAEPETGIAEDRLLLVVHHLAVDGVSWRTLLEDLGLALDRLGRGLPIALPAGGTPFRRWAELLTGHARSAEVRAQLPLWLVAAPADAAPPLAVPAGAGRWGAAREVNFAFEPEESRALLREFPGAALEDALLAALGRAFAPWTDGRPVGVDVEGHGREEVAGADVSRTVGWFTTLVPLWLEADLDAPPAAALRAVRDRRRALPARGLGFGLLSQLAGDEAAAHLAHLPPRQVSFNYLGQLDGLAGPAASGAGNGVSFRVTGEPSGPARAPEQLRAYLLDVTALVAGGRLRVSWLHEPAVHSRAAIEALAARFAAELRGLLARPHEVAVAISNAAVGALGAAKSIPADPAAAAAFGWEADDLAAIGAAIEEALSGTGEN